jgi:hypothetical protein
MNFHSRLVEAQPNRDRKEALPRTYNHRQSRLGFLPFLHAFPFLCRAPDGQVKRLRIAIPRL